MVNVQEPIDLDRVVVDQAYRRAVIKYLNRETEITASRAMLPPLRGNWRATDSRRAAGDVTGAAAE